MNDVKRYMIESGIGYSSGLGKLSYAEASDGSTIVWPEVVIKYSDYQALQAENERLNALLRLATKVSVAGVDINKLKADAVRGMVLDFAINGLPHENWSKSAEEYANKLEAGE